MRLKEARPWPGKRRPLAKRSSSPSVSLSWATINDTSPPRHRPSSPRSTRTAPRLVALCDPPMGRVSVDAAGTSARSWALACRSHSSLNQHPSTSSGGAPPVTDEHAEGHAGAHGTELGPVPDEQDLGPGLARLGDEIEGPRAAPRRPRSADPRTTMRYDRTGLARSPRHPYRRHVHNRRQPVALSIVLGAGFSCPRPGCPSARRRGIADYVLSSTGAGRLNIDQTVTGSPGAHDSQESGIPVGPRAFQRLPSAVAHSPWLAAAIQARSAGRLSSEASAPAMWTPGARVQVWPPSGLVCTRLTPTIQSRRPSGLMAKRCGVSSPRPPALRRYGFAAAFLVQLTPESLVS